MFKITPINEKAKQRELVAACGAEYREDFFAYAMVNNDSGELMGISQFEIMGECGYISDIRSARNTDDFEAMFILGRATMNFIDMCGIHTCRAAKNAGDERLIKAIGFKLRDGEYEADMTGMFDGHCSGKSKENL